MKMPSMSLLEWQKRYGSERACIQELAKVRWPDGFQCPECGSKKAYYIETRQLHQCSQCRHQASVTAGTLFHSTKLPLVKWFWAIFLVASDKGGLSALRASKLLGVSWPTAHNILSKIRTAMAHRDSIYRLGSLIEFDDTYVGGKRTGKRGRGAAGKRPVLVAVETRGKTAGFVAMEAVDAVSKENVRQFLAKHLKPDQTVKTDAFPALNAVKETQIHKKKVTPPAKASEWLPLVHIIIGNMKTFINGTFHGVSSFYSSPGISQ